MEASSTGGSKYLFLPAGHKVLALNRSLSNVATKWPLGREERKWAWFWVVAGVGRAVGTTKRQGETAVQNALHAPVRHC